MILLITGSREATPAMIERATRAVKRAKELGWSILVGDAEGIDQQVTYACHLYQVPCTIFGITETSRNKTWGFPYYQIEAPKNWPKHPFLWRDRYMVMNADIVYAIWNHRSHGTKWTYDEAVRQGKRAHIS